MILVNTRPNRDYRIVLGKNEEIADVSRATTVLQRALECPASTILRAPQPENRYVSGFRVQAQMLIASPYAAAAASITASLSVGCAWMVR